MPRFREISISQIPTQERDTVRDIQYHIAQGNLGGNVYGNGGGYGGVILPSPSRGEQYREYQLGADRSGGAGKHRLVAKIGSDGKSIVAMYYSRDHYRHFDQVK